MNEGSAKVLSLLATGPKTFGEVCAFFRLQKDTAYAHLHALAERGRVRKTDWRHWAAVPLCDTRAA